MSVRLLEVQSVILQALPGDKPSVSVTVQGVAATPGYGNVRLNPLEKVLSDDGILDLEFIGDPPDGIVAQVVTPAMASMVITEDVDRLVGVRVEARTNAMTELLQMMAARQANIAAGPAGLTPVPGGPIPKTLPIQEEAKTLALFEEGKTALRFEEGKTFVRFEEGKTAALFEEGKTPLIFEEQKPVFGETDPRVDDPKPPFGEDKAPFGEDFGFRNPFGGR
ncbi:hypothetical protein [uncultured Tateyamaria sp.]|uniref:hypothetical protein n=1 Tax=uncultured Tateyamaria sp. TaxID=455651 RepID=UPI00262A83BF|nr:hypothetical protein [uncultured Tateyamaria sp.]